jgi:hypothetical protein
VGPVRNRLVTVCDKGLELAQLTEITAVLVAVVNLAAGALGAWAWYRGEAGRTFWLAVRAGQAAATLPALLAAVLLLTGFDADDDLLYLYLLLPIVVSIIAEQLRVASAQTVLDQLGLEDAQAVGRLPEDRQHDVVWSIARREAGVMTIAALVIAFLALRTLGTV